MKGFCVITDENDIVVSISMIPGTKLIPNNYNVYFPAKNNTAEGEEYNEIDQEQFWPGFTVICNKCSSNNVYFENTLGFSELSGGWGELSFICSDCESSVDIYENY